MIDPILVVYLAGALFALVVSSVCLNMSSTFTDVTESKQETRFYVGISGFMFALVWPVLLIGGASMGFFWSIGWLAEKLSGGR